MGTRWRERIGWVAVWEASEGVFKLRFKDPATGRDVRRTLAVTTRADAREMAYEQNRAINIGRGVLPGRKSKSPRSIELADAIAEAIRLGKGNEETRQRARRAANRFLQFMAATYPRVQYWNDLKPSMLVAWVRSMDGAGRAYDTIRLALVPLRRAASYWAAEEPELYRDVAKAAGGGLTVERREKPEPIILGVAELETFLAWLRAEAPLLSGMAFLAGLAGLRIREAAFVRHCDVNWNAGTVTIRDTERHEAKNRWSLRTIPLIKPVLQEVREHVENAKVQGVAESPIFFHSRNGPYTLGSLDIAWRRTLIRAREDLKLPTAFTASDLRKTFSTLAQRTLKVDPFVLQRYIGHKPESMLGRHYVQVTIEDMKRELCEPLERYWTARIWQQTGNAESTGIENK